MNIGELFVKLGVSADTKPLKDFASELDSLPNKIFNLKNVLLGLGAYAFGKVLTGATDSAQAIQNFSEQTGESALKLQQWQRAAQLSNLGITAEEVTSNIVTLQDSITQLQSGMSGGNKGLQIMGIGVSGKDAFKVLEEIREKMKGYSASQGKQLLEQTGLSANLLNVLRLSNAEFEKFSRGRFLNKGGIDQLLHVGREMKNVKFRFEEISNTLMIKLAPVMGKLLSVVEKIADKFAGFITKIATDPQLFDKISKFMDTFANFIVYILDAFMKIANLGKDSQEDLDKTTDDIVKKAMAGEDAKTIAKTGIAKFTGNTMNNPIVINQNIHATGDPKANGEHVATATKNVLHSYQQRPAPGGTK